MYGRKVGYERNESLEDTKLDIDTLGHRVTHGFDNQWDGGLWDSLERYEALKRTKGYSDDFCVLGRATHEDGTEKVVRLGSIC